MLLKQIGERREIARSAILANPAASDRQLAAEIGVSREMIVRIRLSLQRSGTIPSGQPILGRDGKTYRNTPRTRTSFRLNAVIAHARRLAKVVESESWQLADPGARRILWLVAVKLADAIGERIDTATGHLVVEPAKGKRATQKSQMAPAIPAASGNRACR